MPLRTRLEQSDLRPAEERRHPELCKSHPMQGAPAGNFLTPARSAGPALILLMLSLAAPAPARASLFQGETLDKVANAISWVAIVIAPLIGITVFWLVHILPEKIAEKKKHPQAHAIQCLCLLSLVFGGLLWPIAWLWAYTKPVLHKMAYGTDKHDHDAETAHGATASAHSEAKTKENA